MLDALLEMIGTLGILASIVAKIVAKPPAVTGSAPARRDRSES
jgi:hypothetical protein